MSQYLINEVLPDIVKEMISDTYKKESPNITAGETEIENHYLTKEIIDKEKEISEQKEYLENLDVILKITPFINENYNKSKGSDSKIDEYVRNLHHIYMSGDPDVANIRHQITKKIMLAKLQKIEERLMELQKEKDKKIIAINRTLGDTFFNII